MKKPFVFFVLFLALSIPFVVKAEKIALSCGSETGAPFGVTIDTAKLSVIDRNQPGQQLSVDEDKFVYFVYNIPNRDNSLLKVVIDRWSGILNTYFPDGSPSPFIFRCTRQARRF
jgi:hypothetical protein